MTLQAHKVPLSIKLSYGLGAAAYGIKDNGFSVFLLIFYNQIVGIPAAVVGTAIALALVFDAVIDPVLGILSDRTHTKWGRRHPWLYASALPIALTWVMLWHPPTGSTATIVGYLVITAILTRAAIATNEVPSLAMAPELTPDYHERTAVLRYRYLFGWLGGMAMLMLAYGVFLVPPIGATSGPKAVDGYQAYGLFGAAVMALTVLISAVGTHKRMAHPPAKRIESKALRAVLAEARQTLSNRGFVILMAAGIFGYTNQGVGFAMSQYNLQFVWQFGTREFLIYSMTLIVGVFVIFLTVTPVAARLGKVRAAIMFTILSALFVVASYALRLLGVMPGPGSSLLLPVFLALNTTGTALGIGAMIVGASMMSDIVEASEETTGRREEGLFFSGALFMQKCASGLGILVTGLILQAAAFPDGAVSGAVPEAVINRLTLLFILATLVLSGVSALIFRSFPFGEAEHKARVAKLAVAAIKLNTEKG